MLNDPVASPPRPEGDIPLMTQQRDNCNWYRRDGCTISANTIVCTKVCMAGVFGTPL